MLSPAAANISQKKSLIEANRMNHAKTCGQCQWCRQKSPWSRWNSVHVCHFSATVLLVSVTAPTVSHWHFWLACHVIHQQSLPRCVDGITLLPCDCKLMKSFMAILTHISVKLLLTQQFPVPVTGTWAVQPPVWAAGTGALWSRVPAAY